MEGYLPFTPNHTQDGFRLILLEIHNHHVLSPRGGKCSIQFFNYFADENVSIGEKPYSTVIIGANGIGKSFILSALAEIFRHIRRVQNEGETPYKERLEFKFAIHYFLNGHCYKISTLPENKGNRLNKEYSCWEDEKPVGMHRCPLPTAILASAITISDRFKTQKESDNYYWYLGARNENSPSTTGTRTLVRKTVTAIAECLTHDDYFRDNLLSLLDKLGLEQKMEIEYAIRYKDVYLKYPMTEEFFVNIFKNWEEAFKEVGSKRETAPWGHKYYPAISQKPENISIIVNYINKLIQEKRIDKKGHLVYSIHDGTFRDEWMAIQLLSRLDILSYPKIKVYKKTSINDSDEDFLFEDSSTGETSLLCQFVNIMSRIQQHCLVLIDEPEASAHPNWQIRYIGWLNDIFSRFHTCHFILSTHSHFLLSEMEESSSAIVALDRNKQTGCVENKAAVLNTFGWSTDDILYEVFKIRNRKNEALERDLERAIQLIDNNEPVTEEEKTSLLQRLNNVYQGGRDPLGDLIKEFERYAESRSK